MPLHAETLSFLRYLQRNPSVRSSIRAAPDRTLLYAGSFVKPMWKEIEAFKRMHPEYATLQTLPDVLKTLPAPVPDHAHLLAHLENLQGRVPWKPDGLILWKAMSGIFVSNAVGKVSFQIGSGVTKVDKVFAATEVAVLSRNPRIDPVSRDLLDYYSRCIRNGESAINVGYVAS